MGIAYLCLMPMNAQEIERRVKLALPDAVIELTDTAGDNDHYSIVVTSAAFSGKSRVEQHRMVLQAVGMDVLHALAVTTKPKD